MLFISERVEVQSAAWASHLGETWCSLQNPQKGPEDPGEGLASTGHLSGHFMLSFPYIIFFCLSLSNIFLYLFSLSVPLDASSTRL